MVVRRCGARGTRGWCGVVWIGLVLLTAARPVGAQDETRAVTLSAHSGAGETTAIRTAEGGLRAAWVDDAPQIDGVLDDAAWARAEEASGFVQQRPRQGEAASEETRVRVLVDQRAVYIGARLLDSRPDEVVARLARRDEEVVADWFYVYLDSYHDRRTAFGFGVSAAGAQRDLRISDDDRRDVGWDAVWASSVSRDDEGWSVEMRIPLSQLRFNDTGDRSWGLNFQRNIARENETAFWAPIEPGTDQFVSLFSQLDGLEEVESARRIEVLPHTVTRLTRAPGDGENPFYRANATASSVGANVLVGLGSSLTLSAAINPDFGQVEADPATVNLSAFEIFQQERRPFFVEGADIFSLAFPFWPPLFYSRRIGRAPQGFGSPEAAFQDRPAATTILGAVKLSGKTEDGWSIGALNALTGSEWSQHVAADGTPGRSLVEPRTVYTVGRVAKEMRGGSSGVGAMITSTQRSLDGAGVQHLHGAAYSFGTDAFHRFRDGEYIANVSLLGSHVRGSTGAIERTQRAPGHYFHRPDADHVELDPTRMSLTGFSLTGRVQRVRGGLKWGAFGEANSPGYEISDLGFNPQLSYVSTRGWARFEDFTPGRIFQNWSLGTMVGMDRGWGGELLELTADLGFFFQLHNNWGGGIWAMRHRPSWSTNALRGGPALRRPGRWMGSFSVNSDRRRTVSGDGFVFWVVEDEGDGYEINSSTNLRVQPSERLDVRVGPGLGKARSTWQYVGRRVIDDENAFFVGGLDRTTLSMSVRLNYTFSPTLSLQLYARPFLAAGTYQHVREVIDPTARSFADRFVEHGATEGDDGSRTFDVDRNGDGSADLTFADPSFNLASLQMNTVVRWEYRPGSTLFAVWTHDRDRFGRSAWALGDGIDGLRGAPARNVFQLKVSYWMGL